MAPVPGKPMTAKEKKKAELEAKKAALAAKKNLGAASVAHQPHRIVHAAELCTGELAPVA